MSKLDDERGALQIASDSCAHACEPQGWILVSSEPAHLGTTL